MQGLAGMRRRWRDGEIHWQSADVPLTFTLVHWLGYRSWQLAYLDKVCYSSQSYPNIMEIGSKRYSIELLEVNRNGRSGTLVSCRLHFSSAVLLLP